MSLLPPAGSGSSRRKGKRGVRAAPAASRGELRRRCRRRDSRAVTGARAPLPAAAALPAVRAGSPGRRGPAPCRRSQPGRAPRRRRRCRRPHRSRPPGRGGSRSLSRHRKCTTRRVRWSRSLSAVAGPAGWRRLRERGGGATRPQPGRAQGEVRFPETGFIYSPSPAPRAGGGGADEQLPAQPRGPPGQPRCHLGMPTSPFSFPPQALTALRKGGQALVRNHSFFPSPPWLREQGFVRRRPDLPRHESTSASQGLQLGRLGQPEVPHLLRALFPQEGPGPSRSSPTGEGTLNPGPGARQPCPPPACFPWLLPWLHKLNSGPLAPSRDVIHLLSWGWSLRAAAGKSSFTTPRAKGANSSTQEGAGKIS